MAEQKERRENEVENVQFLWNLSKGLRHRIKIKSVLESEVRGEFVSMTDIVNEAAEAYLKGIKEPYGGA